MKFWEVKSQDKQPRSWLHFTYHTEHHTKMWGSVCCDLFLSFLPTLRNASFSDQNMNAALLSVLYRGIYLCVFIAMFPYLLSFLFGQFSGIGSL